MAPSFAPMIGLAAQLSYPLGATVQPPITSAPSAAVLTSAGPLAMGACTLLALQVAPSPAQPAAVPTPMEVNGTAVADIVGDLRVDTSNIYHDREDDAPSA